MKTLTMYLSVMALLLTCFSAKAAIIQLNSAHILTPLNIGVSVEEFYNYRGNYGLPSGMTPYRHSGHTGLEVSNQATFFFVEDMLGQLALFGLIDSPNDDKGGTLLIDLSTSNADADDWEFVLIDDAGDGRRTGSDLTNNGDAHWAINFKWNKKWSDGFVFAGFDDLFDLTLTFSNIKNIDNFAFLSFDEQTDPVSSPILTSLPNTNLFFTIGNTASLTSVAPITSPTTWLLILVVAFLLLYTPMKRS